MPNNVRDNMSIKHEILAYAIPREKHSEPAHPNFIGAGSYQNGVTTCYTYFTSTGADSIFIAIGTKKVLSAWINSVFRVKHIASHVPILGILEGYGGPETTDDETSRSPIYRNWQTSIVRQLYLLPRSEKHGFLINSRSAPNAVRR